ncbi:MAG: hypothetical protein FD166_2800 [Bacteroidetes bacterium]|nr:MAG: hypothetical protein FD166_2800 [Bacteroidota bacterium]
MDLFYKISLNLHSWNRYAILAGGLAVIFFAVKGLRTKSLYSDTGKKSMLFYLSGLHFQLLMGLLLYFVASPITTHAFNDFGAAMKDSTLRFWSVEHAFINLIAIAVAQTGSILVRRKTDDIRKHRTALIWTAVSMALILLMIPMGLMGVDRPWFRF